MREYEMYFTFFPNGHPIYLLYVTATLIVLLSKMKLMPLEEAIQSFHGR